MIVKKQSKIFFTHYLILLSDPLNIRQLQELAFRQQQEIDHQNDIITQVKRI